MITRKYDFFPVTQHAGQVDSNRELLVVHMGDSATLTCPSWREATTWAKAHLRGRYVNEESGWVIHVGSNGIHEGVHRLAAANLPEAITVIPALLRQGIPLFSAPDLKEREEIKRVHTLVAAVAVHRQLYRALVTIREAHDGFGYHGHQFQSLDREMSGDLGEGLRPPRPPSGSHPPDTLRLGLLLAGFKAFP